MKTQETHQDDNLTEEQIRWGNDNYKQMRRLAAIKDLQDPLLVEKEMRWTYQRNKEWRNQSFDDWRDELGRKMGYDGWPN